MTRASDFDLRAYRDSDTEAIVALHDAAHADCATYPAITAPSWRQFAGASFNQDARDFLVAETADGIAGLLTSTAWTERAARIRHFRILVHPGRRRRGIGRALFAACEAQARAGGDVLQCNCSDTWTAGVAFLEMLAFTVHGSILVMRADPILLTAHGHTPPGFSIRSARASSDDDASWLEISNVAYASDPTAYELQPSDLPLLREAAGFDLLFAEADGRPVALCNTRVLACAATAVIESLAVLPSARGRGVGRALLTEALRGLREKGLHRVELTVNEDNAPARKLYERFGFEAIETMRTYRRRC